MPRAAERAYRSIRDRILEGAFSPGEQLREEWLAALCGVSRTPVRDALRRLEAEQLIVRSATKRMFVASWSGEEIEEMFTLRAMLEAHAAERAATRLTPDALAGLRHCNAALHACVAGDPPDSEGFLAHNRRFHELIVAAAGSPRLTGTLASLVEQPVVRRTVALYDRDELIRSAADHDRLIDAFAARDPVAAHRAMTGHVRRAYRSFAGLSPGLLPSGDSAR